MKKINICIFRFEIRFKYVSLCIDVTLYKIEVNISKLEPTKIIGSYVAEKEVMKCGEFTAFRKYFRS